MPNFFYTCTQCGKERSAHYPGKTVCLSCNKKNKDKQKDVGFFGKAFSILKVGRR